MSSGTKLKLLNFIYTYRYIYVYIQTRIYKCHYSITENIVVIWTKVKKQKQKQEKTKQNKKPSLS